MKKYKYVEGLPNEYWEERFEVPGGAIMDFGNGNLIPMEVLTGEDIELRKKMIRYKCRAECLDDVIEFMSVYQIFIYKIQKSDYLNDLEFEFESPLPLDNIIEGLNKLSDCHVMAETLQPIKKYTGVRN